jgi:hypothetical protein
VCDVAFAVATSETGSSTDLIASAEEPYEMGNPRTSPHRSCGLRLADQAFIDPTHRTPYEFLFVPNDQVFEVAQHEDARRFHVRAHRSGRGAGNADDNTNDQAASQ